GMEHQVILPRLDRLGLQFLDRLVASLLSLSQPGIFLRVLVTHALRPAQRAAALEISLGGIYSGDVEVWEAANDVLLDSRAFAGGEEFLFVHEGQRRVDEIDAFDLQYRFVQLQQEANFILERDAADFLSGDLAAGSKAPGAPQEDTHPAAETLRARHLLYLLLTREDVLVAVAVDPDVGVAGPKSSRGGERGIG